MQESVVDLPSTPRSRRARPRCLSIRQLHKVEDYVSERLAHLSFQIVSVSAFQETDLSPLQSVTRARKSSAASSA
jgi:hypothetical protein